MTPSPADLAYGRQLVSLGLAPAEAVRREAAAAAAGGLRLREHLLLTGRVTAEQDERVRAALSTPTSERPTAARPSDPAASGRRVAPIGLPRPGSSVAGHVVERELARGGAGAVFAARDAQGRPVALKVLLAGWRGGVHAERFRREAALGQRLDHPGIVRVLDHGEDDGRAWLTMELLEGALPMDRFAAARGLDARARVDLVVQACDAVQHAHEQGAIHRDLKPQNLLVTPDGRVKVVDLGLARLLDEERLTQSGATMGTIEYMAPEQVKGQTAHADARTDVYALGVVLFELVAGEVPFSGQTSVEVMRGILEDAPVDLDARVSGLPRGLATVVAMALEKDPADRHPSAVALGRDLAAVLAGRPESSAGWERARAAREGRRGRQAAALAVAALVVVASGVAVGVVSAAVAARGRAAARAEADQALAAGLDEALKGRRPLADDGPALAARLAAALDGAGAPAAGRVAAVEGLVALARGDAGAAAGRLEAAVAADDAPEAAVLAAALAAVTSATPAAVAALDAAIEAGARRPELRAWRALGAAALGPLDGGAARRALADLDAAGDAAGQTGAARVVRARALLVLGRADEVTAALGDLAPPPEVDWQLALAAAARALGERDLLAADAALDGRPGPPPAEARGRAAEQAAVARGLLDVGGAPPPPARRGALVAGLRVLRRLAPDEPLPRAVVAALLEASCSYAGSGDVETATALAEVTPDDYEVQRLVGLLADRQRAAEGKRLCLPALRRAVDLAPATDQVELGVRLCALLSATGAREECVAACDRFLPLVADDAEARSVILIARGRVRRAMGQVGPALADLDEAVALSPLDFKATHERALARLAAGDPAGALADASQTLRILPDAGSIENDRMVSLIWDLGRPRGEAALVRAAVERLVSGRPMYSGWWVRLALLQVEADELEGARASFERAGAWLAEEEAPWLRGLAREVAALAEDLGAGAPDARARLADLVRRLDERRAGGARP